MYQCLFSKSLPVKFMAAATIYKLLKNNEVAQGFLHPALNQLLEVYLNLMNDIESDELVTGLERIVAFYKEDMEPYSVKITQQLVDSYLRLIQIDAKDDGGESALAALGCVQAVTRIIKSCKNNSKMLQKIEDIIQPVLMVAMSKDGIETLEESADCIALIIHYKGKTGPVG